MSNYWRAQYQITKMGVLEATFRRFQINLCGTDGIVYHWNGGVVDRTTKW